MTHKWAAWGLPDKAGPHHKNEINLQSPSGNYSLTGKDHNQAILANGAVPLVALTLFYQRCLGLLEHIRGSDDSEHPAEPWREVCLRHRHRRGEPVYLCHLGRQR